MLACVESGNRFKGVFNNKEFLGYNVTPKFSNEFKGPEVAMIASTFPGNFQLSYF